MTIIAWDGRSIAADRQVSRGDVCEGEDKLYEISDTRAHGPCIATFAGFRTHGCQVFNWLRYSGDPENFPESDEETGACVLLVDRYGLWEYPGNPYPVWRGFEPFSFGTQVAMPCLTECLKRGDNAYEAVMATQQYTPYAGMGATSADLWGIHKLNYERNVTPPNYELGFPYPLPDVEISP